MDGFVHPDFHRVAKTFGKLMNKAGGGAIAVEHHGVPVVDLWGGVRDSSGTPWDHDTVALSFSTTKGVVATVVARLVEQGRLDYEAPVSDYWPEFAAAGKQDITIAHLMSHTAAMHRMVGVASGAELLDWDFTTEALASAEPAWEPGLRPGYHGITFGYLVGEVIRRVTGLSVDGAIAEEIRAPLGIEHGMSIGLDPSQRHNYAELLGEDSARRLDSLLTRASGHKRFAEAVATFHDPDFFELFFGQEILDAEVPAANGVFTARSLAKMYARLITPGDEPLLSSSTLAVATTVQTRAADAVVQFPMRWRLGYHLAGTSRGLLPQGFGHFGFGGSGAWADPESGLAVAFITNKVGGTPMGDGRMVRLGTAAVLSAKNR
jgi:CubicO group peptidase (beta-lactamase class C family)